MTICDEISRKIEGYLEDTIDETTRSTIRVHLVNCDTCREISKSSQSFAVDLKKLNAITPPPSIAENFKRSKNKLNNGRKLEPVLRMAVPSTVVLAALVILIVVLAPKFGAWAKEALMQPQMLENVEPEALKQLKEIAYRLGIENPGQDTGQKEVVASGVSIKPLHLHLLFDSEEFKTAFVREFSGLQPDVSFRSADFWVVSLDHDKLAALLDLIKYRKIRSDGKLIADSSLFPDFQGTIRVSLYLKLASDISSLALFQHWDFVFNLSNRFLLLDKIQELGIKTIYQSSEVWVMEIPGSKLKKVMEICRTFPGLHADFGKKSVLPDTDEMTVQAAIYLN